MTTTTTVSPVTTTSLSAALAAMTAYLCVPHQYACIMSESIISMNSQCPTTAYRIDK